MNRPILSIAKSGLLAILLALTIGVCSASANASDRAVYLLDEDFSFLAISTYDPADVIASGWDVQRAGGSISFAFNHWFRISDQSTVLPIVMSKELRPQSGGVVTLEYRFRMPSVMNGVSWKLQEADDALLELAVSGGKLGLINATGFVELQSLSNDTEYGVKAVADLDNGTVDVFVNGIQRAAAAEFAVPVTALDRFVVATGESAVGDMYFAPVKVHKGYAVNERFLTSLAGPVPEDWDVSANGGTVAVEKMSNAKEPDVYSVKMDPVGASTAVELAKSLGAQSGKLAMEFKFLLENDEDGYGMRLLNGTSTIVEWQTLDGQFVYRDADDEWVDLYAFIPNLWYHFKVIWDTGTGKANLYVNGKLKAEDADLHTGSVDGISFTVAPTAGKFSLDDILLYHVPDEPLDYVPAPVAPAKPAGDQPLVGMQACPLWREGQHLGWDRINPYSERKPLLGFYDEGNPEVSDWEIKWLVEHGVDFQMYCWYRPNGNEGKPLKDPRLGMAIHDGLFNAKYSDQSKFMIMWTSPTASGSADFRNNLVPYWLEYYFKDPRYVVIDNKPVLSIFGFSNLKSSFGGTTAGVKAEMDYLRQAVKDAGFDDLILLISSSGVDPAGLTDMTNAGADAVFAYSWGQLSGSPTLQQTKLEQQRDANAADVIPVVTMGRDNLAWGGPTGYYSTPAEMEAVAEWIKDSFIPSLPSGSPGKDMVLFGNWNEYGEGHYIMPSGLHGFGYLDAIRNVFTLGGGHSDVAPTSAQQERIQVLYPQDREVARPRKPLPTIAELFPLQYNAFWTFDTPGDSEGWVIDKQIEDETIAGGFYQATSSGNDPGLLSPDHLGLDAATNSYLHIRMKNESDDVSGKVYFITEQEPNWKETMGVDFLVVPNDTGFTDYYVPMGNNLSWKGIIKAVRLDPIAAPGNFSIDFIGFVDHPLPDIKLSLNGSLVRTDEDPVELSGQTMVPLTGMLKQLGVPFERRADNSVVAVAADAVVQITPGMAVATKDGNPVTLASAAYLENRELMVDADALDELFDFGVLWDVGSQTLYVSNEVVKLLGPNLLPDPGMEEATLAYSGQSVTATLTDQTAHSGRQSVRIQKGYAYAKLFFPYVENGKEYYYSAWSKLASGTTMGQRLRICLQYQSGSETKQIVMMVGPQMDDVTWQQTSGYFKLNETGPITNLTMYVYTDHPPLADTYYLDDVEIREVSYAVHPIPVTAESVMLDRTTLSMAEGGRDRLVETVLPAGARDNAVDWSSDRPQVAIVDAHGAIYGNHEGVARVTVTTREGALTAAARVAVGTDMPATALSQAIDVMPGSGSGGVEVTAYGDATSGHTLFAAIVDGPVVTPGKLSSDVPEDAIVVDSGVPTQWEGAAVGQYVVVYEVNDTYGYISGYAVHELQTSDIAP